jgi:hypothetical protein
MQDSIAENTSTELVATAALPETETQQKLADEIAELWATHVEAQTVVNKTKTELKAIRQRLGERLYEMKQILARPGRNGQWSPWLKQQKISRATADRLVQRFGANLPGCESTHESIPGPSKETAEKLAKSVWQRFGKLLTTDESVILFIDRIAELSGVGHERREEGLMIFSPVHKVADGVIGTDAAAEIACPTPQPAESGEANPADAPAADPDPQLSDDVPAAADELPASAPATGPAPQPSCEASATIDEQAAEAAATPTETGLAAAPAGIGNGNAV